MANRFSGGGRELRLSNGASDVLLSVLQFALSDLAVTPWERALAQWIAWHDQNVAGRGCVGFDLAEIAWDDAAFPEQHAFLLRAVDRARARYRWGELCYDPPFAAGHLAEFRELVAHLGPPPPGRGPVAAWPGPDDPETVCPRHRVHCSDTGRCRVCDDCG